jgi:hypothetical protein
MLEMQMIDPGCLAATSRETIARVQKKAPFRWMSSMRCHPASLIRVTWMSVPVLPSPDPSPLVRSTPAQLTSTLAIP